MSNNIGKKVIIRTYSAGVHYGTLAKRESTAAGVEVTLTDARRLWYWDGAFTLSAVSQNGVKETSKLSIAVPEIELVAIEIIPCSDKAIACLDKLPAHDPT